MTMPEADRMTQQEPPRWSRERAGAALRRAPRALLHDLTDPADPVRERSGRASWRPALAVPLVLCAVLLALMQANSLAPGNGGDIPGFTVLLGLAQGVALAAGMFRPVAAWWASTGLLIATVGLTEPGLGANVPYPWTVPGMFLTGGTLFLLALRVRPRRAGGALVVTLLAGAACTVLTSRPHDFDLDRAVPVLLAVVVVASSLRGLRKARRETDAQAELTAEERTLRTLLEERNRIARELHDVVAHHMSVISIQAQVAPHLVENPSDELRENLAGIRENAVTALTELRRVLGVLRSDDASDDSLRHAPQPTLDQLDALLGRVRNAGLTVTAETTGLPYALPPGVGLTAFRIVQEALSNVLRHAPGAEVQVEIAYRSSAVGVRVTNTAPAGKPAPATAPGVGHGLLGMRERAAMLGGDFADGPTPGGGYEVAAILPLEGPS
ncbi:MULTISPECIES: sensor histidine kinase [unclassified Streptomyces]|uniref:sensor histidine kinase n=1 Tax=unclassified Streptomyces TaxID=2593676 RepID=UPI002E11E4EB|nr:sensor histidine kinase [Streptomyces sp. NBC_01197]WSS52605.1 sensor histidine kinase [Streptomyces sp. NBC_01180]